MRISDWSSDVCSSDLREPDPQEAYRERQADPVGRRISADGRHRLLGRDREDQGGETRRHLFDAERRQQCRLLRSEEHTSELQSLMRISYAVFCLKKKRQKYTTLTATT